MSRPVERTPDGRYVVVDGRRWREQTLEERRARWESGLGGQEAPP